MSPGLTIANFCAAVTLTLPDIDMLSVFLLRRTIPRVCRLVGRLLLSQRAGLRAVRRGGFLLEGKSGLAARLEVGRGAIVVDASQGKPVVQQVRRGADCATCSSFGGYCL